MAFIHKYLKWVLCVVLFAVSTGAVWSESSPNIRSDLPDNDLHALAGLSICFFAAGAASGLDMTPVELTAISLSAALLVGLAKEMIDAAGYGTPEIRDFLNTALGGAVAAAGILLAGFTLSPDHQPAIDSMALFFTLGLALSIPLASHLL